MKSLPVAELHVNPLWPKKNVVGLQAIRNEATARGFEPLRAEPNGFLVHHFNHSVTLSMSFLMLGMCDSAILVEKQKCGE